MTLRVLHVLDHSWPVLDGYSQRSRSIIAAQSQNGIFPVALTGPLHNLDDPSAVDMSLDGIRYLRTPLAGAFGRRMIQARWPVIREAAVVRLLQRSIENILSSQTFDIVHAHSPALCGLAALRAARRFHIPFVYEVRAFWEDASPRGNSGILPATRYRLARSIETSVARRADAVVGIALGVLRDLKSRGVSDKRLFHVPNGVDASRFQPLPRDPVLASELGVSDIPTLGFIGTLFPWEGVSWLVRALPKTALFPNKVKLIIVGDGAEATDIRHAILAANASGSISYLGRIAHDGIRRYYSVIDVLVYPRLRRRLTELVTPLKPLEAMALGKPVLGSDVGGMRELIEPGVTGLLFRSGDVSDFEQQATRLLRDPELRRSLGERARQKVATERNWNAIAHIYESVYATAIRSACERH